VDLLQKKISSFSDLDKNKIYLGHLRIERRRLSTLLASRYVPPDPLVAQSVRDRFCSVSRTGNFAPQKGNRPIFENCEPFESKIF
jgi:hypothetical protein